MIKTIKTTKYLNLHELIKYVWENPEIFFKDYIKETFVTKDYRSVTFYKVGGFETNTCIDSDELFSIEIEEPITEDTEFETVVSVIEHNYGFNSISYNTNPKTSIKKFLESYENKDYKVLSIYALIDNKLQLIWERE